MQRGKLGAMLLDNLVFTNHPIHSAIHFPSLGTDRILASAVVSTVHM